MKIVHTGDWHIGKIVNEYSMIEEQKYYLDKLVELLREKEAEALIISGDIYDRSVPPAEAVELLDTILSKIILELKIPVLAIGEIMIVLKGYHLEISSLEIKGYI